MNLLCFAFPFNLLISNCQHFVGRATSHTFQYLGLQKQIAFNLFVLKILHGKIFDVTILNNWEICRNTCIMSVMSSLSIFFSNCYLYITSRWAWILWLVFLKYEIKLRRLFSAWIVWILSYSMHYFVRKNVVIDTLIQVRYLAWFWS